MGFEHICIFLFLMAIAHYPIAQISSGQYDLGLYLAFNPLTNEVTGYYEGYSGLDEQTGGPQFSCIFYISGIYNKSSLIIDTYCPLDKADDMVSGEVRIKDQKKISIKLKEDHGGCWNVQSFSDGFIDFTLKTLENWVEIKYIDMDKAYFYNEKNEATKRKAYVVKGDIVYIDKIEDGWMHCQYRGKSITEGWIKTQTVNK